MTHDFFILYQSFMELLLNCHSMIEDSCYNIEDNVRRRLIQMKIYKTYKSIKFSTLILFIVTIFSFFYLVSQHTHFVGAQVKVTQETQTNKEGKVIFDEKIEKDSSLPQATLSTDMSIDDLKEAMSQYYKHEYTDDEKKLSQETIDPSTLEEFYSQLSLNKSLATLDIQLDTVEMTLDKDTLVVPRIIITLPKLKAKTFVPDHDILVLNEATTFFNNRIVMVAYLDEENNTITPLHLSNSTKSIFYNNHLK